MKHSLQKHIRRTALLATMLAVGCLNAQLNALQESQIDSLFLAWNQPGHPGGSVGVMQDGQLLYSRAYGLASLEFEVPNKTSTRYNIASVSKQFTAMGILLLESEGKVDLNADIRTYLPELPDFGYRINLRHLMHHTSGLRSLHDLLALAGWRGDDLRTNEDLYRIIKNQRDLNFPPGEQYLYCNTGYILMALIIEKITGDPFADWMNHCVFKPLGMHNTYVEDNYTRVVVNNAHSYYHSHDRLFESAQAFWSYTGAGNIHATAQDLLLWSRNFYAPQAGWEAPFQKLRTLDPLNDGRANSYAFGVILEEKGGYQRILHSGSIGGYRSFMGVYPEQRLNIIVLTNFSSSQAGAKADAIAGLLLEKKEPAPKGKEQITRYQKMSATELKQFEGTFWNKAAHYSVGISLANDTLRYTRDGKQYPMLALTPQSFQLQGTGEPTTLVFQSGPKGEKTLQEIKGTNPPTQLKPYDPEVPGPQEIATYAGTYYSPELDTQYHITVKNGQLFWRHARHGEFEMTLLKKDVLKGSWPFEIVEISRDTAQAIKGIAVSNGRVKKLWMEKR